MVDSRKDKFAFHIPEFSKISEDKFQIFRITPKVIAQFHDKPAEPYRLNFHQIIILTNGSASQLVDGEVLEINAPTVLLIAREKVHSFIPDRFAKGWVILFTDEFLKTSSSNLFSQFFQLSNIPVKRDNFLKKIISLTEMMFNCANGKYSKRLVFIRHLLAAMLVVIEEMKKELFIDEPLKESKNYDVFNSFLNLLESNYKKEHSVGFYTSRMHISSRKLSDICKEILGKTTSQIIEERRIIEAKRLLLYSKFNAQQIAYELGFQDHSYFTKVFKRHTQKTPLRYRQKHLSE